MHSTVRKLSSSTSTRHSRIAFTNPYFAFTSTGTMERGILLGLPVADSVLSGASWSIPCSPLIRSRSLVLPAKLSIDSVTEVKTGEPAGDPLVESRAGLGIGLAAMLLSLLFVQDWSSESSFKSRPG